MEIDRINSKLGLSFSFLQKIDKYSISCNEDKGSPHSTFVGKPTMDWAWFFERSSVDFVAICLVQNPRLFLLVSCPYPPCIAASKNLRAELVRPSISSSTRPARPPSHALHAGFAELPETNRQPSPLGSNRDGCGCTRAINANFPSFAVSPASKPPVSMGLRAQ